MTAGLPQKLIGKIDLDVARSKPNVVYALVEAPGDEGGVYRSTAPILIPGSRKTVQFPTVVAGTVGRAFVAWTESTDKGVQVMLTRGRRGSGAAAVTSHTIKGKGTRTAAPVPAEVEHRHQH
jgi:hypothetical protein